MAGTGVLVDRPRPARLPRRSGGRVRHALALLAVTLAAIAGAALALVTVSQDRSLSVGDVRLSVSLGHRGALDVYVPLVDWGARFEAIRLPARLHVDVRTVDRRVVARVAGGENVDVATVRSEAVDVLAGYLLTLIACVFLAGLSLGLLTALAVRGGAGPTLPVTAATATATALGAAVAVALLLPPRGDVDTPQYYAYGPDIPRALQAVEALQRSGRALDQELDAQLVGLARLVTAPAGRAPLEGRPRLTIAADLHNNVLALPILERAAARGPVLFAGDVTDRGSPLETRLVERVARLGRPFVAVSGNHDSDTLMRRLVRNGAIVLTQRGRLRRDGSYGEMIVRVGGMRVAGYSDPFERRAADTFRDRFDERPNRIAQEAFANWLEPLVGRVDVVLVHEPALLGAALARLEARPPAAPLLFAVGHTHEPGLERIGPVIVLNGGSVGAGGTGNLAEGGAALGIARLFYDHEEGFAPLAADLVRIDPGTGSATARRERLDVPAAEPDDD